MYTTSKTLVLLLSISTAYVVVVAIDGDVAGKVPSTLKPPTTSSVAPNKPTSPPTTAPPKTTTAAPLTTTIAPTTPKTTTVPTSPIPTTPPPVPEPKEGLWWVNATGSNVTCVLLQAALRLDISIKSGNETRKVPLNIPTVAKASGTCNLDKQNIEMTWSPQKDATNQLTFVYTKLNDSRFELSEIDVQLNLTTDEKPGFIIVNLIHKKDDFVVPATKSYKCAKEQSLELISEDANVNGSLKASHVQMEAFRKVTGTKFGDALDCVNSGSPDVVPIAVGCALAVLVLIVLVAYLVGRRRSQARGYLSM